MNLNEFIKLLNDAKERNISLQITSDIHNFFSQDREAASLGLTSLEIDNLINEAESMKLINIYPHNEGEDVFFVLSGYSKHWLEKQEKEIKEKKRNNCIKIGTFIVAIISLIIGILNLLFK